MKQKLSGKEELPASATKELRTNASEAERQRDEGVVVCVQSGNSEVMISDVKAKVLSHFRKTFGRSHYKNVRIYLKPEELTAYYVVNGRHEGKVLL